MPVKRLVSVAGHFQRWSASLRVCRELLRLPPHGFEAVQVDALSSAVAMKITHDPQARYFNVRRSETPQTAAAVSQSSSDSP